VEVIIGEEPTIEEPVQRVEDRRFPRPVWSNQNRVVADVKLKLLKTTVCSYVHTCDSHAASFFRRMRDAHPLTSLSRSVALESRPSTISFNVVT